MNPVGLTVADTPTVIVVALEGRNSGYVSSIGKRAFFARKLLVQSVVSDILGRAA